MSGAVRLLAFAFLFSASLRRRLNSCLHSPGMPTESLSTYHATRRSPLVDIDIAVKAEKIGAPPLPGLAEFIAADLSARERLFFGLALFRSS